MATQTGNKRLQDRIAVITGASSGIGRAIALAYAEHGAVVVVGDRAEKSQNDKEGDKSTVEMINANGGKSIFAEVDTTDSSSVEKLIATAVEKYGRIDIMVNNAGIAPEINDPKPVWQTTDKAWNSTINVNCHGVFHGVRAASGQMVKQEPHPNGDRGWIINMCSVYGQIAAPTCPAYVSSKHLVLGLTRAAALDCAPFRVHVNAICPGYVQSTMTKTIMGEESEGRKAIAAAHPFKGFGKPDDVAAVAVMLASDDARWMTGSAVTADGGFSIQ